MLGGEIDAAVAQAITEHGLTAAAVLSGNRNFEARIHPVVSLWQCLHSEDVLLPIWRTFSLSFQLLLLLWSA